MMQHYQVGKRYRVPCINTTQFSDALGNPCLPHVLPVIGPMHSDHGVVNFPHEHWHIDWRFVGHRIWQKIVKQISGRAKQRDKELHASNNVEQYVNGRVALLSHQKGNEVLYKFLRCHRDMPPFVNPANVPWQYALEEEFKDVPLPKCLTCPHRGLPLDSLRPNSKGIVVCNGHGLHWNTRTHSLVRTMVAPPPGPVTLVHL